MSIATVAGASPLGWVYSAWRWTRRANEDAISIANGGQSVGNDDPRGVHLLDVAHHHSLAPVVEGAGGLVEEDDSGSGRHRSGQQQQLSLASREGAAVFVHHGVHAHGQLSHVVVDAGEPGGGPGVVHGEGPGTDDVVEHVVGRHLRPLDHHPALAADCPDVEP
jgi:hypothetical protein